MGETSPNIMGRFSNSPNIANKKYSGTAKGPMSNSTNSGKEGSFFFIKRVVQLTAFV